mmetsp:Transcript_645/g.1093  ORF Transcript_645/g.1093 Transcript_645/m.1093 type:complete len:733 (-) Transcript_645:268-2466(-)
MWRAWSFLLCFSIQMVGAKASGSDSVIVGTDGEISSNRKRLVRVKEGQMERDKVEVLADGSIADAGLELENALRARQQVTEPSSPRVAVDRTALLDHQLAVKANQRRLMMDKDIVIQVIEIGLQAIVDSIPKFIQKPDPDLLGAMEVYRVELWKIIELVVPEDRKQDAVFTNGKDAWNTAFATAADFKGKVDEFRRTGEGYKLAMAIIDVVDVALRVAGETWPAVQETFDAVRAVILSVGEAWKEFEKGEWPKGISIIWEGVKEAVDDLVPDEVKDTDAYQYVMAGLQATIGDLHKHVYEFKRLLAEARVCYKTPDMRRKMVDDNNGYPSVCPDGYEWDYQHTCFPGKFAGGPCKDQCGTAGYCMDYCGAGKACCRKGWAQDPCECEHSHGYVHSHAVTGSVTDYWQCVSVGPCQMQGGVCKNTHSLLQMNETTHSEGQQLEASLQKKNKKKKKKDEGSQCVPQAQLLETASKLGLDDLASALIQSNSNSDQARALDKVLSAKGDDKKSIEPIVGGMQATCAKGTLISARCYEDCVSGMVESDDGSRYCSQDCTQTGTHPYTGPLDTFCGVDPEAITHTWTEIGTMVMKTIMSAVQLAAEIKDEGFKPENIQDITTMVVEMAKPLAKPICNLTNNPALLARTVDVSSEYDDAMKVFKHFDRNFDGMIDHTELSKKVSILGRNIDIDAGIMTEIDSSKDDLLQFNEFVDWLRKKKLFSVAKDARIMSHIRDEV